MNESNKDKIIFLLVGVLVGMLFVVIGGVVLYKVLKSSGEQVSRYDPITNTKVASSKVTTTKLKEFFLSFEKSDELQVFQGDEKTVLELSESHATHGKQSLLVKIEPGSDFPGIDWEVYGNQVQNWQKASAFQFDVYNNTESSVALEVKFKSGRDYPKKTFSYPVNLPPLGGTQVVIPIAEIAQTCDITQMSYVKIFAKKPQEPIILFFDHMGTRQASSQDQVADTSIASTPTVDAQSTIPLKEGFEVKVASNLDRIFQDGKTLLKPSFTQSATLMTASHEYESFQILIANGKDTLGDVQFEVSDLVNENKTAKIDRKNISWRVVGYVPTKKPYYPVKFVGLWPDPLMPALPTEIKPGFHQPFWFTVYTPEETPPGRYQGFVYLQIKNLPPQEIPVDVTVFDFTLPKESHLTTAFDFYGHITKDRYPQQDKEPNDVYQNRINDLNDQFTVEMLKYRMNPILNVDPTNPAHLGQVDRYRWFGLNRFSLGKYGGTFNNNWPESETELEALVTTYRTFAETLKINKMFPMHYIYTWDEGDIGNPRVAKICSLVHRAHPELKNMVCYHGFWDPDKDPDWGKDIDIWTFQIDNFNEKKMNRLKEFGMEIWMYISGPGGTGAPNLAIDFDSIDYRIIPWICWKYDIKGFLYWCVNWWPLVDPFRNASNTKWEQNGNGLLFYPGKNGPISSLRNEIYRDGMEDYEYLVLLQGKMLTLKQRDLTAAHADLVAQGTQLLTIDKSLVSSPQAFNKDASLILKHREKIARLIEQMNNVLKTTTP